ncbi:MAG: DUF2306 domain-containing protein [Marinibacterium sp.]
MWTSNALRVVGLWVLPLGVALVSYRFLAGVEVTMPFMAYHFDERRLAFLAHVGLAPVALALLPFQFWSRLRRQRPGLHRWLGRLYALAILVAGLGGLVLALNTRAGDVAGAGFGVLAVLWICVTATAVRHAMAGRIVVHRDWMIRSAALTMAAVTLRLYLPGLAALAGFDTAYAIVAWAAWVPNLLVAEWRIRRRWAGVVAGAV